MAESAGMAYLGGMIVPSLPSERLPGHKIRIFFCILLPKAIDASCILGLPILPQKKVIQCIIGTVGSRGPHSIVQPSGLSRYLLTKRNGLFWGGMVCQDRTSTDLFQSLYSTLESLLIHCLLGLFYRRKASFSAF